MKISIDFCEVNSPTAKQVDLVQDMCKKLDLKKPEYTFEAYSKFITEWMEDYEWACNESYSDFAECWEGGWNHE